MSIKQQLSEIGFNEKEVAIYLALMDMGKATPAELAQVTGIKRTTVYAVLNELLKKAVISEDIGERKNAYISLPPDGLHNYVRILQKSVHERTKKIETVISELESKQKENKIHIPKVIFIQHDQLEAYLYSRTPIWNESMRNTNVDYVGYLDFTFTEMYKEWIDWYWNHPTTKGIHLRFLTNETEYEKKVREEGKYEKRDIRFWDKAGNITYNTWIK